MRWLAATRVIAIVVAGLLAVLLLLNLPFYAGSRLGEGLSWRMEHGRLGITRGPGADRNDFWLDANSEGLRWSPEFRGGGSDWELQVPLWIPLALSLGWVFLSLGDRRDERGRRT